MADALDVLIVKKERVRMLHWFLHDESVSNVQFVNALRILVLGLDPIPDTSSIDSIHLVKVRGSACDRLAEIMEKV